VSILSIIAALFINQVQLRASNTQPRAAGSEPSTPDSDEAPIAPGGMH
jgi:hypothetical protein